MKHEQLYDEYITYLDWKLSESQISKGKYSLLKISKDNFNNFKIRYENDETFSDIIVELMKTEIRENKINNILDDDYRTDGI